MFKSKPRIAFVCGLVFVAYLLGSCIGGQSDRQEQELLLSKLKAVVESKQRTNEEVVLRLKDQTGFDWDRVYIFTPYTSMDQIDKALGHTWHGARSTGIDKLDRFYLMVFTSGGKVVHHLRYPVELGAVIYQYGADQKMEGFSPEEAVFRVEIEEGGVVLRRLNETKIGANI